MTRASIDIHLIFNIYSEMEVCGKNVTENE